MECIFCKIIKGEINSDKVYEDNDFLAFLDIAPVNKGHTLVIPKEHKENFLEYDEDKLGNFFKVVKKVSAAVKKAVDADGINIIINNGKAAGQIVMHLHAHIIPRFEWDGLKHWPQGKYENGESEKIKNSIINNLKELK